LGVDLDAQALRKLSHRFQGCELWCCDFLSSPDRFEAALLRWFGKVDVVLLNPPFTNRGSMKWEANILGEKVSCSLGLAFLIRSLLFLSPDGELVALLPSGSLSSERDAEAWKTIRKYFSVNATERFGEHTFNECNAHTTLIRLKRINGEMRRPKKKVGRKSGTGEQGYVTVHRGNFDVTSRSQTDPRGQAHLVHTTHLGEGGVHLNGTVVSEQYYHVSDHAILLPRVSRFSAGKIALYEGRKKIAPSSCIIAMKGDSKQLTIRLHKRLLENIAGLNECYSGTCAQYTTLRKVRAFISSLGFNTRE
jgi:hypothetical protein